MKDARTFRGHGITLCFDSLRQTDYDPAHAICQHYPALDDMTTTGWRSLLAVAVGGTLGCLLRWCLALLLNRYLPTLPPGTLAANLIGCYIIGIALAVFSLNPALPLEWRLFVTTGFCGGLTTFSTFSAEVVTLMQSGRLGWAMGAIATHLVGSLAMTFAGIATVMLVKA